MNIQSSVIKAFNVTKNFIIKNGDIILTVKGCLGVISTAFLAHEAGIKASEALKILEESKGEPLTAKEKFLCVWKLYLPAALDGGVSIASIIGSNYISRKNSARLAGLLIASEKAYKECKQALIENIGEEKYNELKQEQYDEQINNTPVPKSINQKLAEIDHSLDPDSVLCWEPYSNQYFISSASALGHIENHINRILLRDEEVTLNDILYEMELEPTKYGNDRVWPIEYTNNIEFIFTSKLKDGTTPCLCVEASPEPVLCKWDVE